MGLLDILNETLGDSRYAPSARKTVVSNAPPKTLVDNAAVTVTGIADNSAAALNARLAYQRIFGTKPPDELMMRPEVKVKGDPQIPGQLQAKPMDVTSRAGAQITDVVKAASLGERQQMLYNELKQSPTLALLISELMDQKNVTAAPSQLPAAR